MAYVIESVMTTHGEGGMVNHSVWCNHSGNWSQEFPDARKWPTRAAALRELKLVRSLMRGVTVTWQRAEVKEENK